MTTTQAPKLRSCTFLGVPARVGETKIGAGRRLYELHWDAKAVGQAIEHPAGTVQMRVLSGDHRKGTLVVHNEVVTDEAHADFHRNILAACIPATDSDFEGL